MAHKSKKKHIKHLHQHELSSTPPTAKKHAGTKADVEVDRLAKTRTRVVESGGRAGKAGTGKAGAARAGVRGSGSAKASGKRGGIVRSIARAATKKIAAKPKKIIKRATKRVKSLLGA